MKKNILLVVALFASLVAFAYDFEVALWRGETVSALVPDYTELGPVPDGLSVRFGALRTVKHRLDKNTMRIVESFDRVEWDAKGTPRIVEITAPRGAKPGVYKCGMMDVRVVDRELPPANEWKYYLDLWQHPWAVARMSNAKPFSKEHYAAMRPVWELLATAGQKTLTVTLVDQPWNHQCRDAYGSMIGRVKKADGSWSFDYSVFDEYVEFGRSCGLGPHIACYTMCPWGYRVTWRDADGHECSVNATPGTTGFEDFWGDFLADFAAHLKAKGWFSDTYIAMDERSPEDVKIIAEFIQSRAPGMKIAMAGNRKPSEFKGITIDNYSQALSHLTDDFLSELPGRSANGFITTYYVCCSPTHPNNFLESPFAENFWVGVYPAIVGFDGFLRWAWNSWPENPAVDASYHHWRAGDTFLVYPNAQPAFRFLELRNGIVAAEKLRIMKEKGLFRDEIAALTANCDFKAAMECKFDFAKFKAEVLGLVNR